MTDTLNDRIEAWERESFAAGPVTEAFCAVAKAASDANDFFQATAPCHDQKSCHGCSEQAICQMVVALRKSIHALNDALEANRG